MRQLLRASVIGLLLVFGIPAAVLLLAHAGVIHMPSDPYQRSVTEVARANAVQDYAHVLGRPDTVDAPRNVVARSAIVEAAAQLPGHAEGVERKWSFYRVTRTGFRYPVASDAYATSRLACDGCEDDERERTVRVSARVTTLMETRAHVLIGWSVPRVERPVYSSRGELINPPRDTGKLMVTLDLVGDTWRAVSIEPQR